MSVRAMQAVLNLVALHPGESIVAVSHADPIKAIVAAAAGVPLDLMHRLVDLALLRLGPPLRPGRSARAMPELDWCARRAGAVVSDDADFDEPDVCTVGVLGEVGRRLFLFYCRQGLTETTVKVEKQQIAVLSGYLGRIVKELGRPGHLPEDFDFHGTEESEWVVGTIGVSYDEELDRIVIVLEEIGAGEEATRKTTTARKPEAATCCGSR